VFWVKCQTYSGSFRTSYVILYRVFWVKCQTYSGRFRTSYVILYRVFWVKCQTYSGSFRTSLQLRRFNEYGYGDYNASVKICGGQNIEHLRFHISVLTVQRRKVHLLRVLLQMLKMPFGMHEYMRWRDVAKTPRCSPAPHIWYKSRILHPLCELPLLLFVYNCGSVDQTFRGPPQVKAYRVKLR